MKHIVCFLIGAGCASIVCSIIWAYEIDKLRAQAIERGYGVMTNPNSLPKFRRFVWVEPTESESSLTAR